MLYQLLLIEDQCKTYFITGSKSPSAQLFFFFKVMAGNEGILSPAHLLGGVTFRPYFIIVQQDA